MKYYHVTAARNLDSIMQHGLRPQIGERSEVMGEREEVVYLFTSREAMEEAVMNWLGDAFDEEDELVVLEIVPDGGVTITVGFECEATTDQTIPPSCIRLSNELPLNNFSSPYH